MNQFEKRNTMATLEIEGNVFHTDFGRDEVQITLRATAAKMEEIEKKNQKIKDIETRMIETETEMKEIMKAAINVLLQDQDASVKLFGSDNTSVFIADVYSYIADQYEKTMQK